MNTDSNKKHLERQIEMIRDTSNEATYDVIIRMRRDDADEFAIVDAISDAFSRRRLAISARDFLPERRKVQESLFRSWRPSMGR